ncbi:hypothetical protein VP01_70g10 [Puccinia sorghi]|uniref:cellulase n=1 Tax=Puccinia sorghi TaxID=27349 RepID=A0A0L6UEF3_9BASI|nr:hypothetical protein VP01_70g10 [Puccinia sorghi]
MQTTGALNQAPMVPPPITQIEHFRSQNVNAFRIPICWQRMQPKIMGELDPEYLKLLSQYVDHALASNASVIIDLHNYGRRDGKVIGEAGDLPSDSLVDIWRRLAQEFKRYYEVSFGIMNEPHDVNEDVWHGTLQAVVTAIRKTGATNKILLSADNWSHLETFANSYPGISSIQNPDGSSTGLIFELHEYFDSDSSGSNPECTVPHTKDLKEVVTLLASEKRQAVITEFGGGNNPDCASVLAQFVQEANQNGEWVDQSNINVVKKLFGAGGKTKRARRRH